MKYNTDISPAPGWVLVVPEERDTKVDGIQLAVKAGEYHEGEVLAVGRKPAHFKQLDVSTGDNVVYARFNAIEVWAVDSFGQKKKCRLVGMQHIAAIRKSTETKVRFGWVSQTKFIAGMTVGFAAGAAVMFLAQIAQRVKQTVSSAWKRAQ